MAIPTLLFPYIDLIVVILFIITLWSGFRQGFLLQFLNCITVIVSLFLAWLFSPILANTFLLVPPSWIPYQDTVLAGLFYEKVNGIAWFILIFVVLSLLLLILKPIAKAIGGIPIIKQVNKLLGLFFSVLLFGINIMILTFILSTPIFQNGNDVIEQSSLKWIRQYTLESIGLLEGPLNENLSLQQFIVNRDQLTLADIEFMQSWLKDNNIDENTIQEFLNEIGN